MTTFSSIQSSFCFNFALTWILHLRGASIEGVASGLTDRLTLPLKLPMQSNLSGKRLLGVCNGVDGHLLEILI